VSAGFWILGLTFVAVVLMAAADAIEPSLKLAANAVGGVAVCGLAASGFLLGLGFLRVLFSPRVTGAGAAFLGLFLCGALGMGTYVLVGRAAPPNFPWTGYVGQPQTHLGDFRYVGGIKPTPPASFERDFFSSERHAEWLRQVLGEPLPPLRLVRAGTRLYLQYPQTLDTSLQRKAALAVQRLVDTDLDGDFRPSTLPLDEADWEFHRRLESLPRPN
jgi:hypothetical protein